MSLVGQIGCRTIAASQSGRCISSVFACPGIPGAIFLEGNPFEVRHAVEGMVTIFHHTPPRLIPLGDWDILLNRRNPMLRPIKEGEWVRCLSGRYRDDIGFVCRRNPTCDEDIMVAFVPCIPDQRLHKRKRGGRPEPRKWWVDQQEAVWGKLCVRLISDEGYEFRSERYWSGLIIKQITSASLVNIQGSPNDLGPFTSAAYIRNLLSFTPCIH